MKAPPGPPDEPVRAEPSPSTPRFLYRQRHRLTHNREFQAVYAAKLKKPVGPLVVFGLENDLGHPRLGLSVGRRVGGAVTRNAIKRRLREAFRHLAQAWPEDAPGLDLVIVVRPHAARKPADYQQMLETGVSRIRRLIEKELEREQAGPETGDPPAGGPS